MKIFLDPSKDSKSISNCIRSLILKTGLPLSKASSVMGFKKSQFLNWWITQEPSIGNREIKLFSDFFNVSEDQILEGTYCTDLLRRRLFSGPLTLPEKYSVNKYSHVRSSAHIYKYLVLTKGRHYADQTLKKLSISPLIYEDLNNNINLSFFMDFLDILEKQSFSRNEIDSLSGMLFLGIGNTQLGKKFKKAKSYFECFATLIDHFNLFDENFIYKADLDRSTFVLKTFLPFDKHDDIKENHVGLTKVLRYRHLLLSWFPFLSDLPPILSSCEQKFKKDGISTLYRIKYREPKPMQLYIY